MSFIYASDAGEIASIRTKGILEPDLDRIKLLLKGASTLLKAGGAIANIGIFLFLTFMLLLIGSSQSYPTSQPYWQAKQKPPMADTYNNHAHR